WTLARRFPPDTQREHPVILFGVHYAGDLLDGNWISPVESLFAVYLRLRYRARIVFYVNNRHILFITLYRAFGFREFIFEEDQPQTTEMPALDPLLADFSVKRLKAFHHRGVPLGKLALDSTFRTIQKSRLTTPADFSVLADHLRDGAQRIHAAEQVLAQVCPDAVITNHTVYLGYGGVLFHKALASGIPVLGWQGRDARTVMFRRFRPDYAYEDESAFRPQDWEAMRSDPARESYIEQAKSFLEDRMQGNHPTLPNGEKIGLKYQTEIPAWLDGKTPLVGVFTHLPWDAAGSFFTDVFPTLADWIEATARTALENDSVHWVFRVHPAEANYGSLEDTSALIHAIIPPDTPHVHIVEASAPFSSYAMTPQLIAGITVRGTLAVELPTLGIPVICGGGGHTSFLPHNLFPKTPEEYRQVLLNVQRLKRLDDAQIREALLFAYTFFIHKPIRFDCVSNLVDLKQLARLTPEAILADRGVQRAGEMIMRAATTPSSDVPFG
ncbi:MAG: hypothetical protein IAE80_18080, partial [Anaerolinea sp.]|nr:hypothetical protein [Anaerolinea sp.]